MAETIVGDLTPEQTATLANGKADKHIMETNAFLKLVQKLPTDQLSKEFLDAFEKYENQVSGDVDARITKDLDRFDMIMQAYEYEERAKNGPLLQSFFDGTQGFFKIPLIQAWDKRLRLKRSELH